MSPAAAAAAKSLQSCPTLCDPIDGSPTGSAIPGILQARTLEWVAISFSDAWKWKVKVKSLSCVRFFQTPWTAAYQAPLSMRFSRQEFWSGVPLPHVSCIGRHILNHWTTREVPERRFSTTHTISLVNTELFWLFFFFYWVGVFLVGFLGICPFYICCAISICCNQNSRAISP